MRTRGSVHIKSWLALLGFVLGSELAGVLGSVFTLDAIPSWYAFLVKPPLNPPSWLFGPVWTVLYALMGIAAYLVWSAGVKKPDVRRALLVWGIQLALNASWSVVFFGNRSPSAGLIVIAFLWASIAYTMYLFRPISRAALWLMVPYLVWVSFALYLNTGLFVLNTPFT